MRVTIEFEIDPLAFADIDDAEGAAARLIHRAAALIVRNGLPEPGGLGHELRLTDCEVRGVLRAETSDELARLDGLHI